MTLDRSELLVVKVALIDLLDRLDSEQPREEHEGAAALLARVESALESV